MKNQTVKSRVILLICLVFLILFVGLAFFSLNIQKQELITVHKERLQTLADEKALQVNAFLESQKEKQRIIASMDVFREAALYPNDTAKIAAANKMMEELNSTIQRMAIFTNDGLMFIAESGPVPIDYSALPYFISKDKNSIFMRYYDPYQKKDYYSILGPIYDTTEKKNIIGAIAFNIELETLSSLMKETSDIGKNDEIYLIDETGLLLSSSEYIGKGSRNGILIQDIKSEGAKECLEELEKYKKDGAIEKHDEEIPEYINYMGNEVFGAHAYVPAIMGCVIAEESTDEIKKFSLTGYVINTFSKKEVKDEE